MKKLLVLLLIILPLVGCGSAKNVKKENFDKIRDVFYNSVTDYGYESSITMKQNGIVVGEEKTTVHSFNGYLKESVMKKTLAEFPSEEMFEITNTDRYYNKTTNEVGVIEGNDLVWTTGSIDSNISRNYNLSYSDFELLTVSKTNFNGMLKDENGFFNTNIAAENVSISVEIDGKKLLNYHISFKLNDYMVDIDVVILYSENEFLDPSELMN